MGATSVEQVVQLSLDIKNVPGSLATLASNLAGAGVNIEGMAQVSTSRSESRTIHLVTNQVAEAQKSLDKISQAYTQQTILALHNPDKPGVLAKVASMLGTAKINIENVYFSTPGGNQDTIVYIDPGTEHLDQATKILHGLEH